MINCPKCNFTQPKDRFCANCGIDMDTYRPVQPPFLVRLSRNWIVQLSAFVMVVVVGIAFIRSKNHAPFSESIAAIEQVTSSHKNFLSKKPVAPAVIPEASEAPPAADLKTLEAQSPPEAPPKAEPVVAASAEVQSAPTKIKLVFAEVNRGGLTALTGDARNVASFGTYFAGMLPEREDKTKPEFGAPGVNILDSANDLQMKASQPIVVFKGSRDLQIEQNIGITATVTPLFIDDQGAHLQVEVKRTLRAPAGTGVPFTEDVFQEQMVLKKDGRGFMSGLLPHRVLNDDEARILSTNPTILKVLASNDFQSGNSELVLFIEAK